jgi:hypothetical protein
MNLLNKGVYGSAFRRYGKRLRVLPVLEKGEVRARSLRPCERGTSSADDIDVVVWRRVSC